MKFQNGYITQGAETWLMIQVPSDQNYLLNDVNAILSNDKLKEVTISLEKKKRSLDANSALWVILNKMAIKLKTSKEELYMEVLKKYGVFTHIVVKPNAVDKVIKEWRTVENLGEVKVNGKTGVQLQCYFGSSTYTKEEFSVLLNGVIEDAKEIGVEFISKADAIRLIEMWEVVE